MTLTHFVSQAELRIFLNERQVISTKGLFKAQK